MKRHWTLFSVILVLVAGFSEPVMATDSQDHVRDLEAIEKIVGRYSITLHKRGVQWRDICKVMKPRFRECRSDDEYVALVTELLASVGDSQTGIVDLNIAISGRSAPGDELSSGGLGLRVVDRRVVVSDVPAEHPLADEVLPGAVLVEFAAVPIWAVLEMVRADLETRFGFTSIHSMWAQLGSTILPFGNYDTRPARFLNPDGRFVEVKLSRALVEDQELGVRRLPAGLVWKPGAVSGVFPYPGKDKEKKLGYLKITGPLNPDTVAIVDKALESLRRTDGFILDVRGLGGTDHASATAIAARFQKEEVELTESLRVVPRGDWQYLNALVLVQDAGVVEAGETLVWALVENRRAMSVGEATGGWSLTTRVFDVPSKRITFRVGITDRIAEGFSTLPWGEGITPHVARPHGLLYDSNADTSLTVAEEILAYHASGAGVRQILRTFSNLYAVGDVDRTKRSVRAGAKVWRPEPLIEDFLENLRMSTRSELALLKSGAWLPDYQRISIRSDRWLEFLRKNSERDLARELASARPSQSELVAQAALLELLESGRKPAQGDWKKVAKDHADTRMGKCSLELRRLLGDLGGS